MIYSVEIRPPAQRDISAAFEYYQDISPQLAIRFTGMLNETIKTIEAKPLIFQIRYRMVRMALVKIFPFAIHFFIRENTVVIIGCFHTSIDPKRWDKRVR